MLDMYNVYRAVSPEFGKCRLEVLRDVDSRVLRLMSEQGGIEYAIAKDVDQDVADCKLYTDVNYVYLTSYIEQPVRTVRVRRDSIQKWGKRE